MFKSEGKEETLACFLIISFNNKNYWNIKFYNLNENNEIIAHTDYSPLQKEQDITVTHFKVEVNSDKNIALICGFSQYGSDFCFHHNIINTEIIYDYEYPWYSRCLYEYYNFKIKYFTKKMNLSSLV